MGVEFKKVGKEEQALLDDLQEGLVSIAKKHSTVRPMIFIALLARVIGQMIHNMPISKKDKDDVVMVMERNMHEEVNR